MGIYGRYFARYKLPFLIAVACVACEAFCDLLGPTLMAGIINDEVEKGELSAVLSSGGLMLLVTFIGACFAVTRNLLASRVSQRMGADLRYDLFAKIIGFSEKSTDKIESGSLITRMTNDTSQVTQFVNGIMRIFMKAPITCIGSIILATKLNPRLSVIIYAVVAVVGLLIFVSMKLSYPRFSRLQQAMDKINSIVQEYLIGVRLVKAFGTYTEEKDKFGAANEEFRKRGVSSQMIITLTSPLMTLTVGIGTVLAIYFGSALFKVDLIQPGDITAFTIYMAQILSSLLMITNIFNTFVRTKASTARINEVFACEGDFDSIGSSSEVSGAISFENVTFTYPNGSGVPAIRNLSFDVAKGERLAIIGPTGSGKSTICWLLLRFYDIDSGTIALDSADIRKLPIDAVRDSVAIAPQKPMLFSGTVEFNMRWGGGDCTEAEIEQAADTAEAGFIRDMPEGFQSKLGSGGVNISGGQKQRVSIARALAKQSPILILDDSTSALDSVTEAKVRESLRTYDGTIITVTQRCTTAMYADKILVMENGVAQGCGTHAELMQSCKLYQEIYHSQVE